MILLPLFCCPKGCAAIPEPLPFKLWVVSPDARNHPDGLFQLLHCPSVFLQGNLKATALLRVF